MDFIPYLHISVLWIGRETRGAYRSRTKNMWRCFSNHLSTLVHETKSTKITHTKMNSLKGQKCHFLIYFFLMLS